MIVIVQRLFRRRLVVPVLAILFCGALVALPRAVQAQAQPAAQTETGACRRRGRSGSARLVGGELSRGERTDAADERSGDLRARPAVRADDVRAAEGAAGARVDAGSVGADLRDVQDLSGHAGEVHPAARGVHRRDHGAVLRRAPAPGGVPRRHHPVVQPDRHRRQLRRRLVRHPRQHVRQLARRVRQPARQAVSDLRHPAARRHEHRHAADQRRAAADAVHPAVHPRQPGGLLLHRLRHRRVARRRGAAHRRRHLHQDRRHRLGPDEDRLQHQGRRRAQPGRDCGLHGRQRRRLGRSERRRLRDLRRDRRRADLVHPARGEGSRASRCSCSCGSS